MRKWCDGGATAVAIATKILPTMEKTEKPIWIASKQLLLLRARSPVSVLPLHIFTFLHIFGFCWILGSFVWCRFGFWDYDDTKVLLEVFDGSAKSCARETFCPHISALPTNTSQILAGTYTKIVLFRCLFWCVFVACAVEPCYFMILSDVERKIKTAKCRENPVSR